MAAKEDSLDRLLSDTAADEKTGAHASKGFAFQHWWGALTVVEALLAGHSDFAIGMEVKEDVVVLDNPTSPTTVEFCQVKKNEKSGGWLLSELHRRGRAKSDGTRDLSILAKLYKRRQEFTSHPTTLRFVSNVAVKVKVDGDESIAASASDLSLKDLSEKERAALVKGLASELNASEDDINLGGFNLHRTDLPLGQQHVFVAGKLSELIESGRLPYKLPNLGVAARMLASELQTRANSTDYAKTLADLQKRLMTKDDAIAVMAQIAQARRSQPKDALEEAIGRLHSEGHSFMQVKAIERERVAVLTQAVTRTNQAFRLAAQALINAFAEMTDFPDTLGGCMNQTVAMARKTNSGALSGLTEGFLNAVCLLVLNDGIEIDVLHIKAGAQPEAAQ